MKSKIPLFGPEPEKPTPTPTPMQYSEIPIPQNIMNQVSTFINGFEKVSVDEFKNFIVAYFIEIHLKSEDSCIELIIDKSYNYVKQLKIINEKVFKNNTGNDFIARVYSLSIEPDKIKKKEIKDNVVTLKINLKYNKKDKFDYHMHILLNEDNFIGKIDFEVFKGWFGKELLPPKTLILPDFEIFKLFLDAFQIKERKTIKNKEFLLLLNYGIKLYTRNKENLFEFYLILFSNILNTNEYDLITKILNAFDIEKIKNQSPNSIPMRFQENFDTFYAEQTKLLAKLMSQKNTSNSNNKKYSEALNYMVIFYTIYIYYLYSSNNQFTLDKILLDINENNEYDSLMIAKLYLSKFYTFYNNLPTNMELKYSLNSKLLMYSKNYDNITKTLNLISKFIDKDFVGILRIIADNYDKINEICITANNKLNIVKYISLKENDDLEKIMEYLSIIYEKKLSKKYIAVYIEPNTWDFYLKKDNKNNELFEFLKEKLIYSSLFYDEITECLKFLSKYFNNNIISVLKIIIDNYDKIYGICRSSKKRINLINYIIQTEKDDYKELNNQLLFIISKKLENKFETIHFNVEIWLYYIKNNFDPEFLAFLQSKLFESAFYYNDICDCLLYSSTLCERDFVNVLNIIDSNLEIIKKICYGEKKIVQLSNYINQKNDDDVLKIKGVITSIIDKELKFNYNCINFDVNIWKKYSEYDSLDNLILIRSIIYICQRIDPNIDEEDISLTTAIHNVGLRLIKEEKLTGEKLVKFLGDDAVYSDKKIKFLESENAQLKNKVQSMQEEINGLQNNTSSLQNSVSSLESRTGGFDSRISSIESICSSLQSDISRLESRIN